MTKEYEEYLQSETWRTKRLQRLEIAKNRCSACTKSKAVHVHHLTYARILNEEMSDLLPLCKFHHDSAENLIKLGQLTRCGDVLFLAAETLRLIVPLIPGKPTPKPKVKQPQVVSGHWPKEQWQTVRLPRFTMTARNSHQAFLLADKSFVRLMLETPDRQRFKASVDRFVKSLPKPRGRYINNACALYDRVKRKRHEARVRKPQHRLLRIPAANGFPQPRRKWDAPEPGRF